MNDFAPFAPEQHGPDQHGARADGLVIRPAGIDDAARVARLLALRGTTVEEARASAPRMIDNVPVLLLALLPVAEASPSGDERAESESAGRDAGAELGTSVPDVRTEPAQSASDAEPGAPDNDPALAGVEDDLLAPVALSGAFVLPADAESDRPARWTVSGLVVDPDVRRHGVGRALLAAVIDAVQRVDPGADLMSVVNATNHASLALHLTLGFVEVARVEEYAGIPFEGGQGVLLVRGPGALARP